MAEVREQAPGEARGTLPLNLPRLLLKMPTSSLQNLLVAVSEGLQYHAVGTASKDHCPPGTRRWLSCDRGDAPGKQGEALNKELNVEATALPDGPAPAPLVTTATAGGCSPAGVPVPPAVLTCVY